MEIKRITSELEKRCFEFSKRNVELQRTVDFVITELKLLRRQMEIFQMSPSEYEEYLKTEKVGKINET